MLVSALRTHPEIVCYGELFRKNKKEFKGPLKIIEELDPYFHDEKVQQEKWRDFLDEVAAKSLEFRFMGYKLMLNQNAVVLRGMINDPSCKKILLKRDNVLAVYSSEKIARVTGQGSAGRFAEVKTAKVEFVPSEFDSFESKYEQRYSQIEQELTQADPAYFKTTYTELCKPQGIKSVIAFIGADKLNKWKIPTKKRNTSNILDRFTNPEVLLEYLTLTSKQSWLLENT